MLKPGVEGVDDLLTFYWINDRNMDNENVDLNWQELDTG